MNFTTISRIIKLGFTNFKRNWGLSLMATLVMTLTLIIISVFVIFNIVVNTTTESIKEKIDLAVYFKLDAEEKDIRVLEEKIKNRLDVRSVHFVTKEEALNRWNEMRISQKIKEQISEDENPLPFSLDIKTHRSEDLESVANYLSGKEFEIIVDRVSYKENKDIIEKMVNITNFSKKIGIILGIIFVVISVLVILNTVKLAIFTRTKEIEIMRLVGASEIFIRVPFVVEALLYALFATIFSLLLIWLGIYFISPMVTQYLGEVQLNMQEFFISNLLWIFLLEFIFSAIISVFCSIISMGKHLKI